MSKERFNLLLLKSGEFYFEDFQVDLIFRNSRNKVTSVETGLLKMCSKSFVFDPKDQTKSILRVSYKDCEEPYMIDVKESVFDDPKWLLAINSKQHSILIENNTIAPFKHKAEKLVFLFKFYYTKVADIIGRFKQLYKASTLSTGDQDSMIATIVYSRHQRTKFDPTWFENPVHERVIVEYPVEEIMHLVTNPGRLLLSNYCIYFQPYNNIYAYPVKRIRLKSITDVIERRSLLRHVGLEILWQDNSSDDSNILYVAFNFKEDKEHFYRCLKQQDNFNVEFREPESVTLKWQNRLISNYDYLLYLNSLADRTFHDLTQYPIFPWVISDYTSEVLDLNDEKTYRDLSKPVGALNPTRLNRLLERFNEMEDNKYLYGSHYSTPAFVVFYLFRKFPKLMLCLFDGKFDQPDRMFNDVDQLFQNCLTNRTDFKELIPQFYDPTQKGSFLMNNLKINFGRRSTGEAVNHVKLPPWAENSPEKFVQIMRDALESEHVSKNLHHWIDLIFGYKQLGEEAEKAHNLFHYLSYEGSVDLDDIEDIAKRNALKVQISDYGQTPKQIFKQPHVPRLPSIDHLLRVDSIDGSVGLLLTDKLEMIFEYNCHEKRITSILYDFFSKSVFSTSEDGTLKCFDMAINKQNRSVNVGSGAISSCIRIPETNIFVLGSWDNSIVSYDMDRGVKINELLAHDDNVSCLSYLDDGLVISGSWDCTVKIWRGFKKDTIESIREYASMRAYFTCEDKVILVDSRRTLKGKINTLIATEAGEVILWSCNGEVVNNPNYNSNYESYTVLTRKFSTITGLIFNSDGTKIAVCDNTGQLAMFYIGDVENININCDHIAELFYRQMKSSFTSINWSFNRNQLVVGDQNGFLYVWNMRNGTLEIEKCLQNGPIFAFKYLPNDVQFLTAGRDRNKHYIKLWSCK